MSYNPQNAANLDFSQDQGAPNEATVFDLSTYRDQQKRAAAAGSETTANDEDKRSLSKRFADSMLRNERDWAVEINEDTPLVRRWNGAAWQVVNDGAGVTMAASWLDRWVPGDAASDKAAGAWKYFVLRLRERRVMTPPIHKQSIIPLGNRYLNIHADGSIVAMAPDRDLGMTYTINIDMNTPVNSLHQPQPVREDSLFGRFLATSLPDPDIRALVQEQCSATLLAQQFAQSAWWFSTGRTGKGVLKELLARFHQKSAVLDLHKLDKDFGLQVMVGASLITVDEVAQGRWCEDTFKTLVGGNSIYVNRKHRDPIAVRSSAKWIISSNQPPFITDKSSAVMARLCVVEWTAGTIPEADRILDLDKLIFEAEAPMVLDWLLEGVQRIVRRGNRMMTEAERPDAVRATHANMQNDNDSVTAWANEREVTATSDKTLMMSKEAVFASYEAYCADAQREVLTRETFWRMMRSMTRFRAKGFHLTDINMRKLGKMVRHVPLTMAALPIAFDMKSL